jgi:hypothetical protein
LREISMIDVHFSSFRDGALAPYPESRDSGFDAGASTLRHTD